MTCHHRLPSQRPSTPLEETRLPAWRPTYASNLGAGDIVLFTMDHTQPAQQLRLAGVQVQEEFSAAVAIEIDLPNAAFLLAGAHSRGGYLAIFSELPSGVTSDRSVEIWTYTRAPEKFRVALAERSELATCRQRLRDAGSCQMFC